MINYDLKDFLHIVRDSNKNFKPYIFKNFINEEHLPSWFDFLNCIYQEWQEPINMALAEEVARNKETLNGTVIVGADLYINALGGADDKYKRFKKHFPIIFDMIETINRKTTFNLALSGPKICVGPYKNLSHKDDWAAFSLQCQGQTTWVFSDTSLMEPEPPTYKEVIEMNPGDFVFFPKGMYHQIEVTAPRASLQFNTNFI